MRLSSLVLGVVLSLGGFSNDSRVASNFMLGLTEGVRVCGNKLTLVVGANH